MNGSEVRLFRVTVNVLPAICMLTLSLVSVPVTVSVEPLSTGELGFEVVLPLLRGRGRDSVAAAHPTMPLPSYARITNLRNHRSMIVRVYDRGPYHGNREIDLSQALRAALGRCATAATARRRTPWSG